MIYLLLQLSRHVVHQIPIYCEGRRGQQYICRTPPSSLRDGCRILWLRIGSVEIRYRKTLGLPSIQLQRQVEQMVRRQERCRLRCQD